jgi:hypothetical protein
MQYPDQAKMGIRSAESGLETCASKLSNQIVSLVQTNNMTYHPALSIYIYCDDFDGLQRATGLGVSRQTCVEILLKNDVG